MADDMSDDYIAKCIVMPEEVSAGRWESNLVVRYPGHSEDILIRFCSGATKKEAVDATCCDLRRLAASLEALWEWEEEEKEKP